MGRKVGSPSDGFLGLLLTLVVTRSPDLAYDRSRDWSIYCLDPLEQSSSGRPSSDDSVASKFSGVMTGMGLVSHALQEDDRTFNPVSVTGKVIQDQGRQALEVILQMKATMSAGAMAPFAPWPQHPMMFGFPGMPGFFRPPPGAIIPIPAGNPKPPVAPRAKSQKPGSAPTPTSTDASTPATSEATPLPDSVGDSTYTRGASAGPKVDPPKKKQSAAAPVKKARKEKDNEVRELSQPPPGGNMEALMSLATRLNSHEGDEPPPPDTAEGQLLDFWVAVLRNAAPMEGANGVDRKGKKVDPYSNSALFTRATLPLPPNSTQGSSRASSSQTQSQGSSSRSGPGGKTKEAAAGSGKGGSKGMNRSLSGLTAGKKRNLDDEEYDPARKRQKTTRTVSTSSSHTVHASSSTAVMSKPSKSAELTGKGLISFPSTSEILGLKFAPGRAYTTNLDDKPPSDEPMITKKSAPAPETPRRTKKMSGSSQSFHSLALTSPFVSGTGGGDDSLFSEAGTPATIRHLSPFKPLRRGGVDDGARPSSPCERRANITASGKKKKIPKTPVRMLGRRAASSSSSPPPTRRAQPDWAANLPPSSPPAPSSPITDAASLTPADADDEGDGGTQEDLSQATTTTDLVVDVNESPSKFFARYFDLSAIPLDTSDLTQSLLGNPGRGTTPSDATSDGEYLPEFDLDAQGFSSSSFSLDELGWSDAGFTSGPAESEGEFDDGTTAGAASDLDFDVGELLTWVRNNSSTTTSSEAAAEVEELLEQEDDSSTPQRNKAAGSGQDPMKALLDRCAV